MKSTAEIATLGSTKDFPTTEKQQTQRSSNIGTFLRMILLCVLLTGSIAIFICWHFSGKENSTRIVIEDVLKSSKKPQTGNTVFFHKSNPYVESEYSGLKIFNSLSRRPELFRLQLTPREACAIESAALHNPEQQVFLLYESPMSWVRNSKLGLIATLRNISNVNLRSVDLKRYIVNSPFESLIKPIEAHKSVWSRVSEYLGFLSLWRYGGTFLDLDTMTLQNFDNLGTNFAVIEKGSQALSANVFNFASTGTGYHVIKNLAYRLANVLKSTCEDNDISDPDALGRQLLTSVFQKVCHTNEFDKMENRLQCFGLRVYNQSQIYGIPSNISVLRKTFRKNFIENKDKWYVTYDWDYFYDEQDPDKIFTGAYALLAKKNCPRTFDYVKLYEKYVYGLTGESKVEQSKQSASDKSN